MILVESDNFEKIVDVLKLPPEGIGYDALAIDTETTGLFPFHGDRLFSIIIATSTEEFYFNFNTGGLPRSLVTALQDIFKVDRRYFFINAKFDLTMLRFEGIEVGGRIIDGGVLARLEFNDQVESYFSMDYLAQRYLGKKKDDSVERYVKENKLTKLDKKAKKAPDYSRVPVEIMAPYGCADARLTFDICQELIGRLAQRRKENFFSLPQGYGDLLSVAKNEIELTRTLFEMEWTGIKIDPEYTYEAYHHELNQADDFEKRATESLKININSPKQLGEFLIERGYDLPKTPKGQPQTTAKVLEKIDLPEVKWIVESKKSRKKAKTYYANFLALSDKNDILHCKLHQEVPRTGRLSSSEPNLQNLPKEEWTGKEKWLVRNSMVPSPGRKLFMFDYKAQEMHVMIDQAGEKRVLDAMAEGLDVYEAQAEALRLTTGVQISRSEAKAISLGLAYGQGADKLAESIGTTRAKALEFKRLYFRGLPRVKSFSRFLESCVKSYGKIYNPFGRVTHISQRFSYKAINAFAQGTSADIMKTALNEVFNHLKDYKTDLVLTVHDELILDMYPGEEVKLVKEVSEIMSRVYHHRFLPLEVDVEFSEESLARKRPYGEKLFKSNQKLSPTSQGKTGGVANQSRRV